MSYPDAFRAASQAGISVFPNLKQAHSAHMHRQHCRDCWTSYGCKRGADHSSSSTDHEAVCKSLPLTQNCSSAEPGTTDATLCIWQKASCMWSLLLGAPGGCKAASGTALAHGAPGGPCPGGTNTQLCPDTKPSHRQSRAHEHPCEPSRHKITKKVWKSLTRGQKSVELLPDWHRNLKMLMQEGAETGISNMEYTIYPIPDNALRFLLKFSTGAEKTSYGH